MGEGGPKISGGSYYKAKQGDCILSVAEEHGLFWETVWQHANNTELRNLRKDPNVLSPGDQIFIPELREGLEEGQTENRHRFRRKGIPAKARFRFINEYNEPRANIPYVLDINGHLTQDQTDGDGCVEVSIPPNARKGTLTLRDGDREETYKLLLGDMDPVSEKSGAKKRLQNLGYNCGDTKDDRFEQALKAFQLHHKLEVNGKLDEATQEKLLKEHGC